MKSVLELGLLGAGPWNCSWWYPWSMGTAPGDVHDLWELLPVVSMELLPVVSSSVVTALHSPTWSTAIPKLFAPSGIFLGEAGGALKSTPVASGGARTFQMLMEHTAFQMLIGQEHSRCCCVGAFQVLVHCRCCWVLVHSRC